MKHQFKGQRGFTLLELLVVVAIMGLISSIAFVSMQHARAEARDAKRVADISAIRNALELYYHDYGVYPDYHLCNNLPAVSACNSAPGFQPGNWIPSLVPKYMPTLPNDPLNILDNETNQHYIYLYNRWEASDEAACQKYFIMYRLETKPKINECPDEWGGTWSTICGGRF